MIGSDRIGSDRIGSDRMDELGDIIERGSIEQVAAGCYRTAFTG